MRIFVAEQHGSKDPFETEYPGETPGCPWDTILYVPLVRGTPIGSLDERVKQLRSQWRRIAEAVVLRLHAPEANALLNDRRVRDMLLRRFERRPVLLAHSGDDGTVRLTPLGEDTDGYDEGELIAAVRSAEMRSLLNNPGTVLPANDDFHYEGPNGRHYASFYRVGTAIQSIDVLDAVCFWLHQHVADRSLIVLDSSTIVSLALNLERYAAGCGLERTPLVAIESQRSYDEGDALLRTRLRALQRRESDPPRAVILSSVVSSGQLAENLTQLIGGVGIEGVTSVGLYGSAEAPGEVFCRPDELGQHWAADECELPTPTMRIARSTYLLELSIKPEKSAITIPHASKAWDFFDRYRSTDCLSVHRDQHDGDRHHMIHLDVGRLARTEQFKPRLEEVVAQLPEIDLVLCPDHSGAVELAGQVRNLLGVELLAADETELPRLNAEDSAKLRAAKRILVVDDVVITGTRIRGYRHFLRACDFLSGDPPEIHLLVGVARPRDNLDLRAIADMVDRQDRFHPVESLLLPNWDHKDCPWCWETRLLEDLAQSLPQSDKLSGRIELLEDVRHGLRGDLFLPWSANGEPLPVKVWTLGPGSVFHADTEGELFAAVASSIQSMRSAGVLTDRLTYPLAYVLDPGYWLTGRYYDPAITGAILRATHRHDLRTAYVEPELNSGLDQRLAEPASRELRGELLLAIARGHLPYSQGRLEPGGPMDDPIADRGIVAMLRGAFGSPAYAASPS